MKDRIYKAHALTDESILALPIPRTTHRDCWDTVSERRLGIRVRADGRCVFVYQWRWQGKRHTQAIGEFQQELLVAEAREHVTRLVAREQEAVAAVKALKPPRYRKTKEPTAEIPAVIASVEPVKPARVRDQTMIPVLLADWNRGDGGLFVPEEFSEQHPIRRVDVVSGWIAELSTLLDCARVDVVQDAERRERETAQEKEPPMSEPGLRKIVRDPRPYTGLGRTRTNEMIREGAHPKPLRLSKRALGFFVDELIEFQQSLPRAA